MRPRAQYLIGAVALAAIAGGGYWLLTQQREKQALADLVQKTRDTLVFVEGGSFRTGNYQSQYRRSDGTVIDGWAADYYLDDPSEDVTLDSYYLAAFEASYADFNLYLAAQGYPRLRDNVEYHKNLPDRAASMSFEEATKYCAWLGQQAGLTMRLPTEAEWEFAARSRGQNPLWATDDGGYEPGRNVRPEGRDLSADERDPPIGTFPPNPMGLYNLADSLHEWVSDSAPNDPEGAAIFKGGGNQSSSFYERIPSRGTVERSTQASLDKLLTMLPDDMRQRIQRSDDPLAPGAADTTARCAATKSRPPADSGFGQMPQPATLTPPFDGPEQPFSG